MDSEDLLQQLAAHAAVIAQHVGANGEDQQVLAYALLGRADCLAALGRVEEAFGEWDVVRRRFGKFSDGDLRAYAAAASVAKGWVLHGADRWDEALVAYDDAYALAGGRGEPALQVQAVAALYRKALALSALEFSSDAVRVVAELFDRYADDPPPEALPDVADAMLLVAPLACALGQADQAMVALDQLIDRLGDEDNESVRETIGRARISRAWLLGEQGQVEDAINACDAVLAGLGEAPEGLWMMSIRALALAERGDWLRAAGRHGDATTTYQTLLEEFSDGQDLDIDSALARAREGIEL